MSKEKRKECKWGGPRDGAGRPAGGGSKVKICVSVNAKNWQAALSRWKKRQSWLVDSLIWDYIGRAAQETGAL